jgi:hypothetical protein
MSTTWTATATASAANSPNAAEAPSGRCTGQALAVDRAPMCASYERARRPIGPSGYERSTSSGADPPTGESGATVSTVKVTEVVTVR